MRQADPERSPVLRPRSLFGRDTARADGIADVELAARDDPVRALVTLPMLTGVVMIIAGLRRLGRFLRFVSNSVMNGFISAVGVNIVLGQLDDFTGYEADGANRVLRAIDLLLNFRKIDVPTIVVGATTSALIVMLQRTRPGPLGPVVGVFAGSALGSLLRFHGADIIQVRDIAEVPRTRRSTMPSSVPAIQTATSTPRTQRSRSSGSSPSSGWRVGGWSAGPIRTRTRCRIDPPAISSERDGAQRAVQR